MNFPAFLSFAKLTFSKNSFTNTIRVSNSLDPNPDQHSFGYQQATKVAASKERVNVECFFLAIIFNDNRIFLQVSFGFQH